jgi:hypothetical protein
MALHSEWTELESSLDLLATHIRDFAATKHGLGSPADFSLSDECLLEGFLSRIWQAWCRFCRHCVIKSCVGTVDAAGTTVPGLPDALTEAHVSGAAIRAKKRPNPPYWGFPNSQLHSEPTWGDADVLALILTRLRPANSPQMLAAFSSAHPSAKAVQVIRNGAAHNNAHNLNEIMMLRSAYSAFPISHPTHAMFWVEPRSNDFLITHAIDALKDAALLAIS